MSAEHAGTHEHWLSFLACSDGISCVPGTHGNTSPAAQLGTHAPPPREARVPRPPADAVEQWVEAARIAGRSVPPWVVGECDRCTSWSLVRAVRVGPRKGQPLKPLPRCRVCGHGVVARAAVLDLGSAP